MTKAIFTGEQIKELPSNYSFSFFTVFNAVILNLPENFFMSKRP